MIAEDSNSNVIFLRVTPELRKRLKIYCKKKKYPTVSAALRVILEEKLNRCKIEAPADES